MFSYYKLKKVILIYIISLLGACAAIGKPFNDSYLKYVKKGITTKSQVLEFFGPPFLEEIESGLYTWTYLEEKNFLFGVNFQKDLVISFDKNNVVKSFRYSSSKT